MTESSVTDNVHDNVSLEFLSVFSSHHCYFADIFNAVSINMEDWGSLSFSDIGAVQTGSALDWICGETDLIIHNDMDCASSFIVGQLRHLH